jgi:hypothetical protein
MKTSRIQKNVLIIDRNNDSWLFKISNRFKRSPQFDFQPNYDHEDIWQKLSGKENFMQFELHKVEKLQRVFQKSSLVNIKQRLKYEDPYPL